jgi:hypothetical protein
MITELLVFVFFFQGRNRAIVDQTQFPFEFPHSSGLFDIEGAAGLPGMFAL